MVAPIQPGYCFSNQSKAKLRKILGKYKLCLSTYKAVFSLPYGGQRHKAAAGIPNGSAKSPVLSFPFGETKKQLFKGVLGSPAVNSSSRSKTWQCLKILCAAKPPRSVTLQSVNKMMSTIFVSFYSHLDISFIFFHKQTRSPYQSVNGCWQSWITIKEKPSDPSTTRTMRQWPGKNSPGEETWSRPWTWRVTFCWAVRMKMTLKKWRGRDRNTHYNIV